MEKKKKYWYPVKEKKYWYPVGNVAEGECCGWVYLTEAEAKIVKYATNSSNWECMEYESYSGCFWIDLEGKQTEKPTSAPELMMIDITWE